jgi:hypothetical protein
VKLQLTACHVLKKRGNTFRRIRPSVVFKLLVSLELSKCCGDSSTDSSAATYVVCNVDVVQTLSELHITADTIFTEHNVSSFELRLTVHVCCVFRPFLGSSSGMSIQKSCKGRYSEINCKWLLVYSHRVLIKFFFNRHYTPSWVSACSTVVEHSQQEGFTESRCQRHV